MARMTISIPDAVKKRMDRVKEPLNWSAIAAEAFELKLGELARKSKEKTVETVVARLRASKLEHANHRSKEGYEAGVYWATHTAEYDELARLSELNLDEWFAGQPMAPYSFSNYLAFAILGIDTENSDDNENYERSEKLWGKLNENDEEDYCTGFCEGALSVFREVAHKL
jgi:hypothetical protein